MKITHVLFAILGALVASLFARRGPLIVINNLHIEAPISKPKSEPQESQESQEAEVVWTPERPQVVINDDEQLYPEGKDPFVTEIDIEFLPIVEDAIKTYMDSIEPYMGPHRAEKLKQALWSHILQIQGWAQNWYQSQLGDPDYATGMREWRKQNDEH